MDETNLRNLNKIIIAFKETHVRYTSTNLTPIVLTCSFVLVPDKINGLHEVLFYFVVNFISLVFLMFKNKLFLLRTTFVKNVMLPILVLCVSLYEFLSWHHLHTINLKSLRL